MQKFKHEFLILTIVPRIHSWLVNAIIVWKLKNSLKSLEKVSEDEANEDVLLHVPRKLLFQANVLCFRKGCKFIGPPSVLEMDLNFLLKTDVDAFLPVEVFESSEEFRQIISIINLLVEFLEL